MQLKRKIQKIILRFLKKIFGTDGTIFYLFKSSENDNLFFNKNIFLKSVRENQAQLYPPYKIYNSTIGSYTYIAQNSVINNTTIGKFCSIGPNVLCGWGIHPINGLSTSPMFYSTNRQNGVTLSKDNKIEETKPIIIGNDVFIGMNVSILDGVTIGDGAIIGAGSVVSKDIPPYAIALGCPIKITKYRFDDETIENLLAIKWWDWEIEKLEIIEKNFFNVNEFINQYKNNNP